MTPTAIAMEQLFLFIFFCFYPVVLRVYNSQAMKHFETKHSTNVSDINDNTNL